MVGYLLLAWSAVAAVIIHLWPAPNWLDDWVFRLLPAESHDSALLEVAHLRTTPVLLIGSALAALIVWRQNRVRACACVVGPLVAVAAVEWFLKPAVGRRFGGVLAYPSGSVGVVASVATAWAVAVPGRYRWIVVALGAACVGMMCLTVIQLRWHYPTDALSAIIFCVGVVLALDGTLQAIGAQRWWPSADAARRARPSS